MENLAPSEKLILDHSQAAELAERFGTPLYVIDEQCFRNRIRHYLAAFRAAAPSVTLTFASKANSLIQILKIAHEEGCLIDVASEGELRAALHAGIPASDCHFHGNAKGRTELQFAIKSGIGQIMVDNFQELNWHIKHQTPSELMFRLAPGVDPKTHEAISTGQADTKFGFNIGDGSALKAVKMALDAKLNVHGFHCHVGSQLLDPEAQRVGAMQLAQFAIDIYNQTQFLTKELNFGGGLGVEYVRGESPISIDEYCESVCRPVLDLLAPTPIKPVITQEPGRSLIGEQGVTLYQVLAKKTVPTVNGEKTYLSVDGGLSDNPRVVLYGAKYTVLNASRSSDQMSTFTVSGKHCETDTLFADVQLPADTEPGDYIQVLCTGAYNTMMSSNYNRFLRPPTVLITSSDEPKIIQRRESFEDLFARELN
ncbi:MAG: diaminopimelate decarboxylase [Armatimonadetes bacterium]|nr:diaminopimelate decarboxylase [Armatimonadota bacterium]